jgi:protein-tyrosine-phosphatase
LEVNARPWGSMPLPVALGVDFPFAWYQVLTSTERMPERSYRQGVYGRNLELDVAFAAKHLSAVTGRRQRAAFVIRWFSAFFRVWIGREKLDTFSIDDPAPAVAEYRAIAARIFRRGCECVPAYRILRRAAARMRLRQALARAARAGRMPSIVFVCYGNICRSAFAERLLSRALGPLIDKISVRSAGTYQIAGRSSPNEAIQAARHHRADLAGHRSQFITSQILDAATVLIVFDRSNIETLNSQFMKIKCPIILLGSLTCSGGANENIADPYGGGPAMFDRAFALIAQGVAVLQAHIFETFGPKTLA